MYIGLYVTVSGTTVTGDSHYYDVDSRTPKHNLPVLLHRTQEKRPVPFSILPLIETATDFRPIIPSLVYIIIKLLCVCVCECVLAVCYYTACTCALYLLF